jgi:glutamate-ammonia-ligase adenylyltransferase
LIAKEDAKHVGDAYRLMRGWQHRMRLDGAEKTRINIKDEPGLLAARDSVLRLWQEVFKADSKDIER